MLNVHNGLKTGKKLVLLKFEDKNGDGKVQYTADKATNEMVKVDRDIMVLANPAIANLPNWVIALSCSRWFSGGAYQPQLAYC